MTRVGSQRRSKKKRFI